MYHVQKDRHHKKGYKIVEKRDVPATLSFQRELEEFAEWQDPSQPQQLSVEEIENIEKARWARGDDVEAHLETLPQN